MRITGIDLRASKQLWRQTAALLVALLPCVCAHGEGANRKHPADERSSGNAASATPNAQLADPALNARVDDLLRKMTLEEKIGQLAQYSAGASTGPGASAAKYEDEIQHGQVGSLLNAFGVEQTNRYQRIAMEKSRLHIPLLFGLDVIHGYRTTFPIPLGLAAAFDPALVETVARTSGSEARADGVNWVFSPMVDIARDARWGRTAESAGEDPYLGSAIARAWVRGYQQGDLRNATSVAACVKHFAAYGAAVAGRDYNAVDMSDIQLRQVYLEPYRAAIDEGAATVMSSFNSINGVPATANPYTLTQILRGEWHFQGFVVSDWGAVRELLAHSIAADGPAAALKALTAGVDMDMEGDLYRTRLASMVRSGLLPESTVDEAARRILRVKFAMGLFEHPYTQATAETESDGASTEKRKIERTVAAATLVLLKNDAVEGAGNLLPMKNNLRNVALIGPLADSAADMLGSWAGQGRPDDVVTLKAALEQHFASSKTTLTYAKGTEILTDSQSGFDAAVGAAKQSQLVVMALGESGPEMTGEAASRAHIDLPGNQEQLLEAIVATGKPVVLVVFSGRPIALPWAAKNVPAILEAWFPGIEAGHAIVDVLTGAVNPSGRLPVSFPYSVGQEPLYYAQLPTGRPASGDLTRPPVSGEERYMSRYIDEPNAALFPFGWGLSYTRFQYSPVSIDHDKVTVTVANQNAGRSGEAGALVKVGVDVKNIGASAGSEVVQLYLRNTNASVEQPVRQLKGFKRITLAPGEEKHVEFALGFDDLAFYNTQSLRVIEPTKYTIWVGGSSLANETSELEVTQ